MSEEEMIGEEEMNSKTKEKLERNELEDVSGGSKSTCPPGSHVLIKISNNQSMCQICGTIFNY